MTDADLREHLYRAILLLDAGLPGYEAAARRERNSYDGSGLREITHQQRLEAVREMIETVGPLVGYHREDE